MSAKKKLVYFNVKLEKGANPDEVKTELEKLAKGFDIRVHRFKNVGIVLIGGACSKAIYERVFNAKLRCKTRTIQNLNKGPRKISYWVELVAATVPEQLQDRVQSVELSPEEYLTD